MLYGVPTKRLNEQVKRNADRFPDDFMFQLTVDEAGRMRSQIATGSKRNVRHLPFAFTEHGAVMAANVLNSPRAVQMSVFVVRAFVKMRETFSERKALTDLLASLEKKLTGRLDTHEKAIVHILGELKKLNEPPPATPPKRTRKMGFHTKD